MIRKIIITGSFVVSMAFLSVQAQSDKKHLIVNDTIKDMSIVIPQDLDRNLEEALVELRKNYRRESTCNELPQDSIAYTSEDYINRLYALPSEMELAYNQIVQSYIDMYTSSRRKKSVEYMLGKGKYYFPMIEETLDKHGLPLELKYLPIIESALNPVAKSRMGATGLWQFMLRTGKMYGLEVNTLVDERKDPRKATEAAAKYLKDLYDIYGDWNLVIAAYNCGPGNVNKAIRRSGGLTDYWTIYPYLPRETRGYVPAFIAATYVMNYYHLHNICPMEESYPVSVDTVWVNKTVNLNQIAESLNIPIEDVRSLNPQYHKDIIPGEFKQYSLCLPTTFLSEFITNQNDIYNYKKNNYLTHRKVVEVDNMSVTATAKATKTHKVRRGESLGSIANKYGVTVAHLKRMNNMNSSRIYAGKQLIINRQTIQKPKKTSPEPASKPSTEVLAANKEADIISPKDTATRSGSDFFANYYKKQASATNTDTIVDAPKVEVAEAKKDILERNDNEDIRTIYHKVKIGETILQIANKYNVTTKEVLAWNNMSSKRVKIGQRLKLKVSGKTIELNKASQKEKVSETLLADNSNSKNDNKIQSQPATGQRTVRTMPDKKTSSSVRTTKKKKPVVYHVRKGDSLYLIAKRYKGISAKDIMLANNLKSDKLSIGQRLNIPSN